jgi:hypothetical protein
MVMVDEHTLMVSSEVGRDGLERARLDASSPERRISASTITVRCTQALVAKWRWSCWLLVSARLPWL